LMNSRALCAVLGAVTLSVMWVMRLPASQEKEIATKTVRQPEEIYMSLRQQAFEISPGDLDLATQLGPQEPYGVLMEMGFAKGTATLASFISGDASLYFSTGGGILGGSGQPNVKQAAKQFVSLAQGYLTHMQPAATYPLPQVNKVWFYVLTPQGIVAGEADERALSEGRSALSPLFDAGQEVITAMRLVEEERPK